MRQDGRRSMLQLLTKSMINASEVFAVCYTLISSICLVYQLRNESFVTVDCRGLWIFCLENERQEASVKYVLNGKDMEARCNSQGSSVLFQAFLLVLVAFEVLIFVNVIYKYRVRTTGDLVEAEDKRALRLVYSLVIITGILIGVLIVLPLVYYLALSKATEFTQGAGVFNEIISSPLRALLSLVITLSTTPLRSFLQNHFSIDLSLDSVYPNFTCVAPVINGATGGYKCPTERTWPTGLPGPLACASTFQCADDCLVIVPRIIMSSLSVILASFALCYRLLKLRHATVLGVRTTPGRFEQETCLGSAIVADERRGRNASGTRESLIVARREMKEKTSSMETAVTEEGSVCTRELEEPNRPLKGNQDSSKQQSSTNQRDSNQQSVNGAGFRNDGTMNENLRSSSKRKRSPGKNGDRTQARKNNGLLRGPRSVCFHNGALEELDVSYSSGEELAEEILVEDESEYYMSGFRL